MLTVIGTFGESVVLETLVLSILNHDSAVAAAGERIIAAAGGRPVIEMGSRRTDPEAAVVREIGFGVEQAIAEVAFGGRT